MRKVDKKLSLSPYEVLLDKISQRYIEGQAQAIRSVNESIVSTNWDIGRYIVEFEQDGMNYMRLFYLLFPICETLSHKLSWSHYCELVKIDNELERSFYYQQNILENWSIRELRRQKETGLFLRLAVSKNKDRVLTLAKKGQIIETPEDLIKDVYVFEFLKIPEPYSVSESELETRLIDNLQNFLLELGKGFACRTTVPDYPQQYRIPGRPGVLSPDIALFCPYRP